MSTPTPALLQIDALQQEAEALLRQKKTAEARALFEQVLQQAGHIGYHPALARAHCGLSHASRLQGAFAGGIAHGKLAVKHARASRQQPLLLQCLSELAANCQLLRQYAATRRHYRSALLLAQKLNDLPQLVHLHSCLAWLHRTTGSLTTALQHAHQAVLLVAEVKDPYLTGIACMGMGVLCSETGNDDLAIDYHLRSLAALEQANLPFQVANALDNLAETYGERQQWEKAEAYKLRSYAIREKGTNPYIKLLTQLSMARLYIHTHRYPVAELHLAQATQMAGQHYPALLYEVHRDQALLHMHTQAWPQAIASLQLFWQNRKQAGDKTDLTHAHLQLGLCYTATQQYKEADKHLQTALATAHRQKSLKQLEKIYEALSALAREQQQHKEALEYLQLYNHYREQRINQTTEHRIVLMQMQYETQKKDEEIAALRQQLQAGHTPAVAAQYGLSPREREILQLLVAGNSYKAMAQALRIEYETVRTHLKRLYAKLSVSNNTEAVAKAVKEGLV